MWAVFPPGFSVRGQWSQWLEEMGKTMRTKLWVAPTNSRRNPRCTGDGPRDQKVLEKGFWGTVQFPSICSGPSTATPAASCKTRGLLWIACSSLSSVSLKIKGLEVPSGANTQIYFTRPDHQGQKLRNPSCMGRYGTVWGAPAHAVVWWYNMKWWHTRELCKTTVPTCWSRFSHLAPACSSPYAFHWPFFI